MILYLHGFGGCGLGKKVSSLRDMYGDKILAPSLSNIPELAIDTLEQIIELLLKKGEVVHLIGSSIGGYFSIYLAEKYNLKAVLINPAIYPYKITQMLGKGKSYYDDSKFDCTLAHIENLKKYEVLHVKNQENLMLLLQTDDAILDYKVALQKLPKAQAIVEEGGSHGFDNFPSKFAHIEEFLDFKI